MGFGCTMQKKDLTFKIFSPDIFTIRNRVWYSIRSNRFFDDCRPLTLLIMKPTLLFAIKVLLQMLF